MNLDVLINIVLKNGLLMGMSRNTHSTAQALHNIFYNSKVDRQYFGLVSGTVPNMIPAVLLSVVRHVVVLTARHQPVTAP